MAGDWIKMRGNLWDDPRVSRLVEITDSSEAAVIGALYWLWATADQHTEDGAMPGLTLKQIDRKTGLAGIGAALCEVGWLHNDPQGAVIARFEEHNGTSAKRRCTDAQRKAFGRKSSASDADKSRTDDGKEQMSARDADKSRTDDGQVVELLRQISELEKEKRREEKRKEEKEDAPRKRSHAPACPDGVAEQVWYDWLQLRKAKKAPVTQTVLDGAVREAAKADMSLDAFLSVWCRRGSQGLEASWLKPDERAQAAKRPSRHSGFESVNYSEGVSHDGSF